MDPKNKSDFSLLYKLLTAVVLLVGLCMCFVSSGGGADMLFLFAVQYGFIAAAFFAALIFFEVRGGVYKRTLYYIIKGTITVGACLDILSYSCALSASMKAGNFGVTAISNALLCLLGPLLVIFDGVMFDRKGNIGPLYPLCFAAPPFLYIAFACVRAYSGGSFGFINGQSVQYPYSFLDFSSLGVVGAVLCLLAVCAVIAAVSYLLFAVDLIWAYLLRRSRTSLKKEAPDQNKKPVRNAAQKTQRDKSDK